MKTPSCRWGNWGLARLSPVRSLWLRPARAWAEVSWLAALSSLRSERLPGLSPAWLLSKDEASLPDIVPSQDCSLNTGSRDGPKGPQGWILGPMYKVQSLSHWIARAVPLAYISKCNFICKFTVYSFCFTKNDHDHNVVESQVLSIIK